MPQAGGEGREGAGGLGGVMGQRHHLRVSSYSQPQHYSAATATAAPLCRRRRATGSSPPLRYMFFDSQFVVHGYIWVAVW